MGPMTIQPVILSGGAGTRLWPLSQPDRPKQLLTLVGSHSLLQTTLQRVMGDTFNTPTVIANHAHRFETAAQLEAIGCACVSLILEPVGRNTAAAIATACLLSEPDALLLALPADHYIESQESFMQAVQHARLLAESGHIVTFGITPSRAETGYGYMQQGEALEQGYKVHAFTEKPDAATAETYIHAGSYWWNSGMFLFRTSTMLEELRAHAPDILSACEAALANAKIDADFTRLAEDVLQNCRALSIDHAVMEKTDRAALVPLDCGWSDIGSWHALIALLQQDSEHHDRPWGWFRSLLTSDRRQVKELLVQPGLRMSLQRHQQRSEHWLVLEGQAEIHCEGGIHLLSEGESFFVPKGAWHRITNPAGMDLRIIEVQEGEYLGEDDIERQEDDFGRC